MMPAFDFGAHIVSGLNSRPAARVTAVADRIARHAPLAPGRREAVPARIMELQAMAGYLGNYALWMGRTRSDPCMSMEMVTCVETTKPSKTAKPSAVAASARAQRCALQQLCARRTGKRR